jgi:hypothetical protein
MKDQREESETQGPIRICTDRQGGSWGCNPNLAALRGGDELEPGLSDFGVAARKGVVRAVEADALGLVNK